MVAALVNPVDFAEIVAQERLNPAEQVFVARMAEGAPCIFGEARPDPDDINAPVIRADLVRFFAWGGNDEARVKGNKIFLHGAHVRGDLDLNHVPSPYALALANCHFPNYVMMAYAGFRSLNLMGSYFAKLLLGHGMRVGGDLCMNGAFVAECGVDFLDANIGGNLLCDDGIFKNNEDVAAPNNKGKSITANGVKIGGNVFLRAGLKAEGEVRLLGANIAGDLDCRGGHFKNKNGPAIVAERAKVSGNLLLGANDSGARLCADGGVQISSANIAGDLDCGGGAFLNPESVAFAADGVKVGGELRMNSYGESAPFFAHGRVRLVAAKIGVNWNCTGGNFNGGIVAESAKIENFLFWREVRGQGAVNLQGAAAGTFHYDKNPWDDFNFILGGFAYKQFAEHKDVQSCIRWLSSRPATMPFSPQPFEQAAKVLFAMGRGNDARKILFAMEQCITKEQKFPEQDTFWSRVKRRWWLMWRQFGEHTTGYNYSLWRMARTSAAIILAGAAIFGLANHCGYIVPHQPVVLANADYKHIVHNKKAHVGKCSAAKRPRPLPTEAAECLFPDYPRFNALSFSADVFIPLFALHQESFWYPQPRADINILIRVLLLVWYWIQVLAGWVLTSIFVLTITGIVQQRQAVWGGK